MVNIYAITDSHQESRNLSRLLSGIYGFEKDKNQPFIILDGGDLFKGIYDKKLSVNAYIKIKKLLPKSQIFITIGNNDFGFCKNDFNYLKKTIQKFEDNGIDMVCANLSDIKTNTAPDWIKQYKIIEIDNKKILITGFCVNNSCAKKFGYQLLEPEKTLAKLLNEIEESFDNIIILNHNWYPYSKDLKSVSNKISLIIGGHEHSRIEPDYDNSIFYPLSFARTMFKMQLNENLDNIKEICLNEIEFIEEFEQPIIEYEKITKLKEPIAKRVFNLTKKYSDPCPLGTFISDNMKKTGNTDIAFHSTGFTMYHLRLEDGETITKYDIERVICANSTIEKVNLTPDILKKVFENAAKFRMEKEHGNSRFIQCSKNVSVTGKGNPYDKSYEILQISIDGTDLLDENGNPINPDKTISCTIDPYIGSGEQGFEVLKSIPKEKILKNGKEVPINELFYNALKQAEENFDGNPNYPSYKFIDI